MSPRCIETRKNCKKKTADEERVEDKSKQIKLDEHSYITVVHTSIMRAYNNLLTYLRPCGQIE